MNSLGSYRITATESNEKKVEFRRSIVLTKDLEEGSVLNEGDLDYKRPGGGFTPEMTDFIIGRTLSRDLKCDHILKTEDII